MPEIFVIWNMQKKNWTPKSKADICGVRTEYSNMPFNVMSKKHLNWTHKNRRQSTY